MEKQFTFKDTEHSKILEDYANQQLAKIEEFLQNERSPIYVEMVFEPSKVHAHHKVELRIKSPHYNLIMHEEGPEFYDVVDQVIDGMYLRLRQEKDKHLSDRKMCGRHEEFKKQR